ncbi:hypothetical protein HCB39_29810 [Salinispora arenicola]|nr:hypothetical protein [Salinispora arenicola]
MTQLFGRFFATTVPVAVFKDRAAHLVEDPAAVGGGDVLDDLRVEKGECAGGSVGDSAS